MYIKIWMGMSATGHNRNRQLSLLHFMLYSRYARGKYAVQPSGMKKGNMHDQIDGPVGVSCQSE